MTSARPSAGLEALATLDPALVSCLEGVAAIVFDFDGVFTDNHVYVFEDGREAVRAWRSDGLGLKRLAALGIRAYILSTETNGVVTARARKLGIPCRQGIEDKGAALDAIATELGVSLEAMAYLGNDINDVPCLERVGCPVAVRDAHPDVLPFVRFTTRAAGGRGAVRELCDLIYAAHVRRAVQP